MRVAVHEENGRYLVMLMGKSTWKAKASARCTSEAERDAVVARYEAMIAEHDAELAARRQARSTARRAALEATPNPFNVGDVVYDSWGYEQTNIDFYEVVGIGQRSVVLRPIKSALTPNGGQSMSGRVEPRKGEFTGPEQRKSLQVWVSPDGKSVGKPRIPSRHGSFSLYDGEPVYCSWYA